MLFQVVINLEFEGLVGVWAFSLQASRRDDILKNKISPSRGLRRSSMALKQARFWNRR
jgi:hypothetical protein